MKEIAKSLEIVSEESAPKIPAGAVIVKKSCRMVVEKIKNGWLLRKSYDVTYRDSEESDDNRYAYWTDSYYSKENPVELKTKMDKKDLIDNF